MGEPRLRDKNRYGIECFELLSDFMNGFCADLSDER